MNRYRYRYRADRNWNDFPHRYRNQRRRRYISFLMFINILIGAMGGRIRNQHILERRSKLLFLVIGILATIAVMISGGNIPVLICGTIVAILCGVLIFIT